MGKFGEAIEHWLFDWIVKCDLIKQDCKSWIWTIFLTCSVITFRCFFKNVILRPYFRFDFSDQSAKGTEVKKIILKIYHALTQYILPMELIPKETFVQWMEILKTVVEQEMPGTYYLFWIQRFSESFVWYIIKILNGNSTWQYCSVEKSVEFFDTKNLFMSSGRYFRMLFWDENLFWYLGKQNSYWSKTGFFSVSQLKK